MEWPLFMTRMTETWREGRNLVDGGLRPGAMVPYREMMQEKTRDFLARLFAAPEDLNAHIKLLVGHLVSYAH
jgi:hypothetical protein